MWPGFSDYLSNIPAKSSVLDNLRTNKAFLQNMMELCMEICLDSKYDDILGNLEKTKQELIQAASSRQLGEYATDKRSKMRRHQVEQHRIKQQNQG